MGGAWGANPLYGKRDLLICRSLVADSYRVHKILQTRLKKSKPGRDESHSAQ